MLLTEADLAVIEALIDEHSSMDRDMLVAGYEAGLRAGLERAAVRCDQTGDPGWGEYCAAAIRALAIEQK